MKCSPLILVLILTLVFTGCDRPGPSNILSRRSERSGATTRIESLRDFRTMFDRIHGSRNIAWRGEAGNRTSLTVRILSRIDKAGVIEKEDVLTAIKSLAAPEIKTEVGKEITSPITPPKEIKHENWAAARAMLDLDPVALSTLDDGRLGAILKSMRTVKAGDIVSVIYRGRTYRWRISSVTRNGVFIERLDVE